MKLVNKHFVWCFIGKWGEDPSLYTGISFTCFCSGNSADHCQEMLAKLFPDLEMEKGSIFFINDHLKVSDKRVTIEEARWVSRLASENIARLTPDPNSPDDYLLIKEDVDNTIFELHGSYDNAEFVARLIELGFEVIPEE